MLDGVELGRHRRDGFELEAFAREELLDLPGSVNRRIVVPERDGVVSLAHGIGRQERLKRLLVGLTRLHAMEHYEARLSPSRWLQKLAVK